MNRRGYQVVPYAIKHSVAYPVDPKTRLVKISVGLQRIRTLCKTTKWIEIPLRPFMSPHQSDNNSVFYCRIHGYENNSFELLGAYDTLSDVIKYNPFNISIRYNLDDRTSIGYVGTISALPSFVSGTTLVKLAKSLMYHFGVQYIRLYDASSVSCKVADNLNYSSFQHSYSHYLVYTKGLTYYEQFGFQLEPEWKKQVHRLRKFTTSRVRKDIYKLYQKSQLQPSDDNIAFIDILSNILFLIDTNTSTDYLYYKTIQSFNCIKFTQYEYKINQLKRFRELIPKHSALYTLLLVYETSYGSRTIGRLQQTIVSPTYDKNGLNGLTLSKPITIKHQSKTYTFTSEEETIVGRHDDVEEVRVVISDEDIISSTPLLDESTYGLLKKFANNYPGIPNTIRFEIGVLRVSVFTLLLPTNQGIQFDISSFPEYTTKEETIQRIHLSILKLRKTNWLDYISYIRKQFNHPKCKRFGQINYSYQRIINIYWYHFEPTSYLNILQVAEEILQNTQSSMSQRFEAYFSLLFSIPNAFLINGKIVYNKTICKHISLLKKNMGGYIRFPLGLFQSE